MLRKYPNAVPIPGSKNKERIRENLEAWKVQFTPEEFSGLEAALAACGIPAAMEMGAGNRVTVTAPAGTQNIAEHYHLIRGLIPAHLDILWEQSL